MKMLLAMFTAGLAAINLYMGVSLLQAGEPAAFQLATALFCSLTAICIAICYSKK